MALVISPGGVASTAVMLHLGRFVRLNDPDDQDGLKHMPWPPSQIHPDTRVLFIYGDVDLSVASLKRRDYLGSQAAKLRAPLGVLAFGKWREFFVARAIRRQIQSWQNAAADGKCRLLFVSQDEIWESAARIAKHFGISDPCFCDDFPKKRRRLALKE